MKYKLRAHHGMCIYFFEGKGYSDEFTAHMAQTIEKLRDNAVVTLADSTDEVCRKCPNNKDGACDTAELVKAYDDAVLARCGLTAGTEMLFSEFEKLVYENILSTGERERICGDCQWNEICKRKK